MLDKLIAIEAKYSQIAARLAAPETYDDPAQVARLNKEQAELAPLVKTFRTYQQAAALAWASGPTTSSAMMTGLSSSWLRRTATGFRLSSGFTSPLGLPMWEQAITAAPWSFVADR